MSQKKIVRALISVSDKSGIAEFARKIANAGIEILSTGGTARLLKKDGIAVTAVESYTGHPEIMDGRVKTLHPKIHGGILAIRDNENHIAQMLEYGISPIDLVVVNLYPFEETIARSNVTISEAIENIDIGGPTMLRSSAKNHKYVAVVVDPQDYDMVSDEIRYNGFVSESTQKELAIKAFKHTAEYDTAITTFLSGVYSKKEAE